MCLLLQEMIKYYILQVCGEIAVHVRTYFVIRSVVNKFI